MADSVFTDNEVIAGLDLGSTKVSVIVAEQTDDGVDIIGIGSVPCSGLKKGVVVNIDATVRAIRAAIEQAETMSGVRSTVYAGMRRHVTDEQRGRAAIATRVTHAESPRALAGQGDPAPADRSAACVAAAVIVDGHDGIPERRHERVRPGSLHLVTARHTRSRTSSSAQRVNLHVAEVV